MNTIIKGETRKGQYPMFTWQKFLLFLSIIALIGISVIGYVFPNSTFSKLMIYYNSISSLVIVLLTLAYVVTTNKQLKSMTHQMSIMDKSINLQIQPLPVPRVKKAYLEKINAYVGPEDKFASIRIEYRFHQNIELTNAGSGAALNIIVFTSLISKEDKSFPSYFSKDQVHCLSTKDTDKANLSIMALDNGFGILDALLKNELVLKTDIYYKNIFGAGFHEQIGYFYYLDEEDKKQANKWLDFLKTGLSKYSVDMKRYNALHEKVPGDAKEIINRIRKELESMFSLDITLRHFVTEESFNIKIVDYSHEVKKMGDRRIQTYEEFAQNRKANLTPASEVKNV